MPRTRANKPHRGRSHPTHKRRSTPSKRHGDSVDQGTHQEEEEEWEPEPETIFLTETTMDAHILRGGQTEDIAMTFASAESNGFEAVEVDEGVRQPGMAPLHGGRYRIKAYVAASRLPGQEENPEPVIIQGAIWQKKGRQSQPVTLEYAENLVHPPRGPEDEPNEGLIFDFGNWRLVEGETVWLGLRSSVDLKLDASSWLDMSLVRDTQETRVVPKLGSGAGDQGADDGPQDVVDDKARKSEESPSKKRHRKKRSGGTEDDGTDDKDDSKAKPVWLIPVVALTVLLVGSLSIYFLVKFKKKKGGSSPQGSKPSGSSGVEDLASFAPLEPLVPLSLV